MRDFFCGTLCFGNFEGVFVAVVIIVIVFVVVVFVEVIFLVIIFVMVLYVVALIENIRNTVVNQKALFLTV